MMAGNPAALLQYSREQLGPAHHQQPIDRDLLSLALLPADHPGADRRHADATVEVYALDRLTPEQARRLDGQSALFLVKLDSLPSGPDDTPGWTAFDCAAPPGFYASVWFHPDQVDARAGRPDGRLLVRAVLRAQHIPPCDAFPWQVEYRLLGAVRCW